MVNKRKKISDAQIQAYMDEALDLKTVAAVEKDLAQDAQTRSRLEEARLLQHALRSSAPKVPSDRMWQAISHELSKTAPEAFKSYPKGSSWRLWLQLPAFRLAIGAACVALVLIGLSQQQGPSPTRAQAGVDLALAAEKKSHPPTRSVSKVEQPVVQEKGIAAAPAAKGTVPAVKKESSLVASALRQPSQPRPALPAVKAGGAKRGSDGMTDVERALQTGNLDQMIMALRQQQENLARTPQPEMARNVALTSSLQPLPSGVSSLAAQAVPTIDADGFWNWRRPAVYMNQKNWSAAGAEFDRARREANEASERSFGASARLSMNQVQGLEDDLGLGDLRRYSGLGLVVLKSGAWQLLVPNRQARFQGAVQTRLHGYRSEGSGFIYELNFDRGEFAPGTQFTRMAGELAATAIDAQGNALEDNSFVAERGAEFIFATGELRLK